MGLTQNTITEIFAVPFVAGPRPGGCVSVFRMLIGTYPYVDREVRLRVVAALHPW